MKLRPYQRNACMSAVTGLETAHTLLESPTGTGKTEMAIAISEAAVRRKAGPVLVVAPTDEIYGQMITRYQRAGWQVHADKADRHARPALAMEQALDGAKVVVVASLGTVVLRDRIERYPRDGWSLALLDEAHHSPSATWQGVREYIDQPWLGLSATPEREGMAKLWPNHVRAFENGLMDAIEQGWLVPFEAKYAAGMSQADYMALKSDDPEEVGQALPAAIATLQEALGQRQGIAFWPRTRAAKQAAKYLRSLPEEISARALVGGMPRDERSLALRQYAACTLRMLTLCQVGVEGLDVPPAAVLAIFQQTKIRTRIAQMVGRVLRPDARCLEGLDEATAEERRDAIARSSKPSAFVLSVAPPDAVDGWETPGTLLWGQLPQPVLIDIDRRQRQGKDLETARREAVQAEDDRKKEREAKRAEYERALLAAAPARAQAVANARPYELRDPAMVARDTRRQRLASAWRKWRERARQANVSAKLGHSDIGYKQASDKQAAAIAKLAAEWLREPRVSSPAGDLYREVLTWDSKTAISAQHALRMMCGHGFGAKQRTA
jgi:superfamily II DNA or RNA helicase